MKLHLSTASGINLFTAYGIGHVDINQQRHTQSLIVLPEEIVKNWPVTAFEELAREHFDQLAELRPEIVLLGTGEKLRFPPPALTRPLIELQIGLETMDTQAACRTYNILAAEGRKVAAAIII